MSDAMIERSCAKRTCILMVQPWTLFHEMAEELLFYARELRKKGVFVACLTYADQAPADFIRASDASFFMRSGIFGRFSGISDKEAAALCPSSVFLDMDYSRFVSLFDVELKKRDIDHVLVVGGFREACALSAAKRLCRDSRIKGLKVRLVERLLMSGYKHSGLDFAERIAAYKQASGCDISVSRKDPKDVYLKYFS